MKNRLLFSITALIEVSTGIALILFPALTVELLLHAELISETGLVICRVAGAAIIAISVMCWLSRHDNGSIALSGLLTGMLLYNIIVGAVLIYAGYILHFSALLLLAIFVHLILAVWCIRALQFTGWQKKT